MSAARDKARWAARKANRQCGRCGDPLPAGHAKTSCPRCLASVAEMCWKTYVRRLGIVPATVKRRPYRPIGSYKAKTNAELCKSKYERRRAAGLCVWCPNKAREGRAGCEGCRKARKLRALERAAPQRLAA